MPRLTLATRADCGAMPGTGDHICTSRPDCFKEAEQACNAQPGCVGYTHRSSYGGSCGGMLCGVFRLCNAAGWGSGGSGLGQSPDWGAYEKP